MMDNFSRYRTPAIFGSILPAPRDGDGDRTMSDVALVSAGCRGRSVCLESRCRWHGSRRPFNRPQPG
jgi:hypothetical protein